MATLAPRALREIPQNAHLRHAIDTERHQHLSREWKLKVYREREQAKI